MNILSKIGGLIKSKPQELKDLINQLDTSTSAALQVWLTSVNKMANNPHLNTNQKRMKFRDMLDELNEATFVANVPRIMEIIQRSKDKCEPYANTEEQVQEILQWLPRLVQHKEVVTIIIEERRRRYKLVV